MIRENKKPKIKVALIVDEYFGAVDTAFGGYGFLARRHIAKYLPNSEIEIEVLLGKGKYNFQRAFSLIVFNAKYSKSLKSTNLLTCLYLI